MPWCPDCGTEYREGEDTCSSCGTRLVENPGSPEEGDEWAFLGEVADVNGANIIKSLLDLKGIPLMLKHRGAGEYLNIYMGMSSFGVELYVPLSSLKEAREIVNRRQQGLAQGSSPGEEDTAIEGEYMNSRRRRAWGLLWLFYLPALLGAVLMLLRYIYMLIYGR